jgi:hypothetical protein
MLRDDSVTLIIERIFVEILVDESTSFFLEGEVRCGIVWGRQAAEVRWFGEGEWVGRIGGHDVGILFSRSPVVSRR